MGAVLALVVEESRTREECGDRVRDDELFDEHNGRSDADEVLEGVLRQAAATFEERKLPFLGHLYTSVAHDVGIDRAPRSITVPGDTTVEVLRALAHPLRLALVAHIAARGPVCSCHLEADIDASQPQISKHLGVLHRAGLLERRGDGRWVYFRINEDALDAAGEFVEELKASMHVPHVADHC